MILVFKKNRLLFSWEFTPELWAECEKVIPKLPPDTRIEVEDPPVFSFRWSNISIYGRNQIGSDFILQDEEPVPHGAGPRYSREERG